MKHRRVKRRVGKSKTVNNDINIMSDGMLEAVTPTDLAILSVAIQSPEAAANQGSDRKNQNNH